MKKILIVFFIIILICLSGFNLVTTGSNINQYENDSYYQLSILAPATKSIGDLDQPGTGITIYDDNVWLEFSKDFINEEQKFDIEFGLPIVEYDEDFSLVTIPNSNFIQENNKPMLPVRTLILNYPPGTKVIDVKFIPKFINELLINKPILPAVEPLPITNGYDIYDGQMETKPNIDDSVYLIDALYPEVWYHTSTGMGLSPISNERALFLVIQIYPVKYNPIQSNIFYLTSG
jgi:hypothetical protein